MRYSNNTKITQKKKSLPFYKNNKDCYLFLRHLSQKFLDYKLSLVYS